MQQLEQYNMDKLSQVSKSREANTLCAYYPLLLQVTNYKFRHC